jgi:H+-transporting ATPase
MQVVCTTTMAVGSKHLSEKKAVVARLSAIEELAGMSILCSDKTGTLTKNQVRLKRSTSIDDPHIPISPTSDPSFPTPPPHSSRSASPT